MTKAIYSTVMLMALSMIVPAAAQTTASRPIWFGTTLDAQAVMSASQQLAKSLANPSSSQWRAKGDQKRTYRFAEANKDEPYRICVPASWDGASKLPLVLYLHGAGSNESTYLDMNNKQMVNLAAQHGFLLVSPMGDQGAYGNFLRLTAPFGDSAAAAKLMEAVTPASEQTNELSEKDVINVLELILNEYPIDRTSMFLAGHSMGSGGTWYIGGKYRNYWNAIAPMSGPFVQKSGYPWDSMRTMPIFITEGTQAPSLDASRVLRDWMNKQGLKLKYKEVNADHGGMIPLVLPDVFTFFDSCRVNSVGISTMRTELFAPHAAEVSAKYLSPQALRITLPPRFHSSNVTISILGIAGRKYYTGVLSTVTGEVRINGIMLPAGVYHAWIRSDSRKGYTAFGVVR
jgi:poly(3-hydroxybutyrate) depolymerase